MFLDKMKLEFDFIGIAESRISKTQSPSNNINLQNYSIEHTHTETTAVGALVYINKKHYKICSDLTIYEAKKLESVFIEIVLSKKSNIIVGCIYKHPLVEMYLQ